MPAEYTPESSRTSAHAARTAAERAESTYHVQEWGEGFFFVNDEGHVAVRPILGSDLSVDLHAVTSHLRQSGTHFPLLLRFQDLLQSRVRQLNDAFRLAIEQRRYRNVYRGVFPIKVNQLREVVEEILDAGKPYRFGLECGSKAELMATLPYLSDDMLLICNGCKDAVMIRLMLEGQEMNRNIIPVLERFDEFSHFVSLLPEVEAQGQFGVRVRLSTNGAGLWSESGGENSKFGLSISELMTLLGRLEEMNPAPAFRLLHFHLGSQIADLRNVRQAVREAARVYASLYRRGVPIEYLDIGGGLGVSYEAGNPDVPGHINYSIEHYALAVVEELGRVCDEEDVPHPAIISESGRAITAFHSVLVVEALGLRTKGVIQEQVPADAEGVVGALASLLTRLREGENRAQVDELRDALRQAEEFRAEAVEDFREGRLTLEQKSLADRIFWSCSFAIQDALPDADQEAKLPPELTALPGMLADHYLCNFSVFRSVVDYWAIGQRFPVMPLHRHHEPPTRRGILVDLTCDSDGEVSDFVAPRGDKRFLELHDFDGEEPYLIGFFLMGAYQDIMGDMHNLFGRVTEAHIYADSDEPDNFYVEKILDGATVEEQLALVQYFPNDLERRMNDIVLEKVRSAQLKPKEAALLLEQYRQAFREYTYLNTDPTSGKKHPIRGTRIRGR